MSAVVHIAAQWLQVGPFLRQRCAWCGATLIDYNLELVAVPAGQDPRPATWPAGELVAVDGNASYVLDHRDGDQLPDGACARLDPEVTR